MNAPLTDTAPSVTLQKRLRNLKRAADKHSPAARAMVATVNTYAHEGIYRQTSAGDGGSAFKRARRRLESFARTRSVDDTLWLYRNDNRALANAMQALLEYL